MFAQPLSLCKRELGSSVWSFQGEVPKGQQSPELLPSYVRSIALERGGEWRVETAKDEVLAHFGVNDLAREMGCQALTLDPRNQIPLAVARMLLGVPAGV